MLWNKLQSVPTPKQSVPQRHRRRSLISLLENLTERKRDNTRILGSSKDSVSLARAARTQSSQHSTLPVQEILQQRLNHLTIHIALQTQTLVNNASIQLKKKEARLGRTCEQSAGKT